MDAPLSQSYPGLGFVALMRGHFLYLMMKVDLAIAKSISNDCLHAAPEEHWLAIRVLFLYFVILQ
jgi:hypothetical protein